MIAVSTLLKSCATPPASWPIACIFWPCAKFSCSVRCSVVSSAKTIALAPSSLAGIGGRDEKARRTRRGSRLRARRRAARSRPLPSRGLGDRGRAGRRDRARPPGSRIEGLPSPPAAFSAAGARRAKAALGRSSAPPASTAAMATGVELKMRANRTSAARRSSPLATSPGARLMTSERDGPGPPSLEKATLCRMRAGRTRPLARLEIDVERLRLHFARPPATMVVSIAPPSPAMMSPTLSWPSPNWARS